MGTVKKGSAFYLDFMTFEKLSVGWERVSPLMISEDKPFSCLDSAHWQSDRRDSKNGFASRKLPTQGEGSWSSENHGVCPRQISGRVVVLLAFAWLLMTAWIGSAFLSGVGLFLRRRRCPGWWGPAPGHLGLSAAWSMQASSSLHQHPGPQARHSGWTCGWRGDPGAADTVGGNRCPAVRPPWPFRPHSPAPRIKNSIYAHVHLVCCPCKVPGCTWKRIHCIYLFF